MKTTVSYDGKMDPAQFGQQVDTLLDDNLIVHIQGVDLPEKDLRSFYNVITDQVGNRLLLGEDGVNNKRTGNDWFEVRYDPAVKNAYRHSNEAQPLHTDGSYIAMAPDYTCMYALSQARAGGETIFIDGVALVNKLEILAPDLLAQLQHEAICFSKTFAGEKDQKTRPIISGDAKQPCLTWNYYCVDENESEAHKQLCESFHQFLQQHIVGASAVEGCCLQKGEAVIWQDEYILHGRNAFTAEDVAERFLVKTSIQKN